MGVPDQAPISAELRTRDESQRRVWRQFHEGITRNHRCMEIEDLLDRFFDGLDAGSSFQIETSIYDSTRAAQSLSLGRGASKVTRIALSLDIWLMALDNDIMRVLWQLIGTSSVWLTALGILLAGIPRTYRWCPHTNLKSSSTILIRTKTDSICCCTGIQTSFTSEEPVSETASDEATNKSPCCSHTQLRNLRRDTAHVEQKTSCCLHSLEQSGIQGLSPVEQEGGLFSKLPFISALPLISCSLLSSGSADPTNALPPTCLSVPPTDLVTVLLRLLI